MPESALRSKRDLDHAVDLRGWNLALAFQEVFTAIIRLRYNRQAVHSADSFRVQMKQSLRTADHDARSAGRNAEDVRQAVFAVVAFLDESALSCRNPAFADWARLPLQTELFGHLLAGDVFFQDLEKTLSRNDSVETADLLEVYYLCLLLGFKGRYAAGGGDLHSIMASIKAKIARVRDPYSPLSPHGAIPADAFHLVQSDPWIRRLGITAVATCVFTIALFLLLKFLLISWASQLSASAVGLVK
jgi:type VI secretion system protein ImpK